MAKSVEELAKRWLGTRDGPGRIETKVLQSAIDRQAVSRDTNEAFTESLDFGQRVADAIARIGGSWSFIIAFLAFLALWAITNAWLISRDPFDPYPFVFLNLILSMLAALQAPVIMMSQNRQSERDRLAAAHDYAVNLKAEIEIMALHEKLDEMRHREIVTILSRIETLAEQLERIERAAAGNSRAQG